MPKVPVLLLKWSLIGPLSLVSQGRLRAQLPFNLPKEGLKGMMQFHWDPVLKENLRPLISIPFTVSEKRRPVSSHLHAGDKGPMPVLATPTASGALRLRPPKADS